MAKKKARQKPAAKKKGTAGNAHKHLTEVNIDELALTPGIRHAHIKNCESCRTKLSIVTSLYAAVEESLPKTHHRVQKLASAIGYDEHLLLQPFDTRIKLGGIGSGRAMVLLSEQVIDELAAQELTLAIFAIPSRRLIARVAKKRYALEYHIHILTEDADLARYIIVGLPGTTQMVVAPTNNLGIAVLSAAIPIDWSVVGLIVILPNMVFELPEGLNTETLENDGTKIAVDRKQETTLSFPSHATHVLAVMENKNPVVREIREGQASFTKEETLNMRQLRVFSERKQTRN